LYLIAYPYCVNIRTIIFYERLKLEFRWNSSKSRNFANIVVKKWQNNQFLSLSLKNVIQDSLYTILTETQNSKKIFKHDFCLMFYSEVVLLFTFNCMCILVILNLFIIYNLYNTYYYIYIFFNLDLYICYILYTYI